MPSPQGISICPPSGTLMLLLTRKLYQSCLEFLLGYHCLEHWPCGPLSPALSSPLFPGDQEVRLISCGSKFQLSNHRVLSSMTSLHPDAKQGFTVSQLIGTNLGVIQGAHK